MKTIRTVYLDVEDKQNADDNAIKLNEAVTFGIKFLIADKEGIEYPDCNLLKRYYKIVEERNELLQFKLSKEKPIEEPNEEVKKEIEDEFKEIINVK
jgi:hypothetical protein